MRSANQGSETEPEEGSLPDHGPGTRVGDRYRLDDEIRIGSPNEIWRGTDLRLQRPVSIRLLPADSPRAAAVKAAALRAAAINSKYLIPVLDLVEDEGMLAVVSDWTDWPTLGYLAHEPMHPKRAVDVAIAIGMALKVLSEHGSFHGRLHPNSVHIDSHGQVRLRGHQVDAALHGLPLDTEDGQRADARSQLAMLYLALTGYWPDGRINGRELHYRGDDVPPPERVVADVPDPLNRLLERGFPAVADDGMGVREINAALAVARDGLDKPKPANARGRSRKARIAARSAVAALVALMVGALVTAGITQANDQERSRANQTSVKTDDGVVLTTRDPRVGDTEDAIPIEGMTTLDPYGDGSEYPQMLWAITDSDPGTSWLSKPYFTADVGGKPGVGVVFDLGQPREVSAINLELVGTSTDLTVLSGDEPYGQLSSFSEVTSVRGAGQSVFIRFPRPVNTSALLVWFTKLSRVSANSYEDSSFRAGIRGATVYGPRGTTGL